MDKYKDSSKLLTLLSQIYNHNKANDPIWFSKLTDEVCSLTKREISAGLDILYDLGTYEGEWGKVNGQWVRQLIVTEGGRILLSAHIRGIE